MPKQYRRTPIIVEAIRFTGLNLAECSAFIRDAEIDHAPAPASDLPMNWMSITTPDHYAGINKGHWIVKYDDGSFDVLATDVFHATYEPIGGDE